MPELKAVFEAQRRKRWDVAKTTARERAAKLLALRDALLAGREELYRALHDDFRKNPGETDLTEIFPVVAEINYAVENLAEWMRPVAVNTPASLLGTSSEIRLEPKGVVLILSPWNYPVNLLLAPLVAAIAAGNCCMLAPSDRVPRTNAFLKKLLAGLFTEDEVAVFEGGADVAEALLELPFDHIFFTGSPRIGKLVMAAAAKNLTPVTLELGGKSPVIIDETADIRAAAERTVWGKFVNAGQTCVAPDYLMIHESRAAEFTEQAKRVIAERFGPTEEARRESPDFCRLVSAGHSAGLTKALAEAVAHGAKVEIGGVSDAAERYLAPTLLSGVSADSPIMKEEIFGPILPMLTYRSLDEVLRVVRSKEKPLALYVFSRSKAFVEEVLGSTTAGGTCVNSTLLHLANPDLPFGGTGHSGMGSYHGYFGFRALSHERAVLRQGRLDTVRFFYPPYTDKTRKLIRLAIDFLT